ncbi:MAG TPA: ribosome biogenesis GTPase YlqF [Clostridiaceae bacterium]|nr:ribosome biogenesis GTPase YlqF [Clostridiaceae bacterium]
MNINWYPGHMAKSIRLIGERLQDVDAVIELCDARIPQASRNPALEDLVLKKPELVHILWLNKADLADPLVTEAWRTHYESKGLTVLAGSALEAGDRKRLIQLVRKNLQGKIDRSKEKGIRAQTLRLMMIGIPNCGKSTLINALAGRKAAAVEDRPGVTRGIQWIRTSIGFDLLDMPGVLWPRLGNRHNQIALAGTGAIQDRILDIETVAYEVFQMLIQRYPNALKERYKMTTVQEDPYALWQQAAIKRGCVRSGGKPDEHRFAVLFLDEFRNGTIGRISLEQPDDPEVLAAEESKG